MSLDTVALTTHFKKLTTGNHEWSKNVNENHHSFRKTYIQNEMMSSRGRRGRTISCRKMILSAA